MLLCGFIAAELQCFRIRSHQSVFAFAFNSQHRVVRTPILDKSLADGWVHTHDNTKPNAESQSGGKGDGIGPPRPVFARRQIQPTKSGDQEAVWDIPAGSASVEASLRRWGDPLNAVAWECGGNVGQRTVNYNTSLIH